MKQTMNFAQISRTVILSTLIFFAYFTAASAQTVIPTVCVMPIPKSGTTTLTSSAGPGSPSGSIIISLDNQGGTLPIHLRLIANPGGTTEEPVTWASINTSAYTVRDSNGNAANLIYPHSAGETVQWFTDATIVRGYNNTSSSTVNIPRGVSSHNFFTPGPLVYSAQPNSFLSGIHTAFSFDFPLRDVAITWILNNSTATASKNTPECATITYQGRLNNAGSAANGNYDLQFTAYDPLTGGTPQSEKIAVTNVSVTNGVFTVPLNFSATFSNNFTARFLEIGVRPAGDTGAFTILAPRQPITSVPYAVNAQIAGNATQLEGKTADQFLQISPTAAQTGNFNISGNGTINGNLTVSGNLTFGSTINGTVTNAVNATNAAQLGGVPATNYLTNSSNFGQTVTTAIGTNSLIINQTVAGYTLIPGLTQTVNVPANSAIQLTTDGGIISSGAVNTFSVVDVALYVDGAVVAQRRIVISNNPLPASVGNWNISLGPTLARGNHTIEVRARHGFNGSAESNVSSGSDPLLRGQLTVTVIRK